MIKCLHYYRFVANKTILSLEEMRGRVGIVLIPLHTRIVGLICMRYIVRINIDRTRNLTQERHHGKITMYRVEVLGSIPCTVRFFYPDP